MHHYTLTLRVRGSLEGMETDFAELLQAQVPRPARIFLIDLDPAVCLTRIRAGRRQISYFEAGARDANTVGAQMVEDSELARCASTPREANFLRHLVRMRATFLELAPQYPHLVVVENTGELSAVVDEVLRHIDS